MSRFVPNVYLHAPNGVRIGRVRPRGGVSRAFSRSEFESASFSLPSNEPLIEQFDPALGNFVVVESEIYPLPWIGYVAQWRGEPETGLVEMTCDSLAMLLRERTLPSAVAYTGSIGQAFRDVVALANGQSPTGVGVGEVIPATVTIPSNEPLTLGASQVGDALDELATIAGWEWWVEFGADSRSVSAVANFAPWRGVDKSSEVVLIEDGVLDGVSWTSDMTRQSWAVTVFGGQQHAAQVIDDVPVARRTQLDAQSGPTPFGKIPSGLYDGSGPVSRREALVVIDALRAQGLAETASVSELLARSRLPPRRIRGSIVRPNVWQAVRPGDLVTIKSRSAFVTGYDGLGRVEALQPDEERGEVGVVLSLWSDRDAEG